MNKYDYKAEAVLAIGRLEVLIRKNESNEAKSELEKIKRFVLGNNDERKQ
jgi:hypothetical protein